MPEATNAFLDALRNGSVEEARTKMMACKAYARPNVLLYAVELVIHDIRDGEMLHMLLSAPRVRGRRVRLNQPLSDEDTALVDASGCGWMKTSVTSCHCNRMPWMPVTYHVSVLEDIIGAKDYVSLAEDILGLK